MLELKQKTATDILYLQQKLANVMTQLQHLPAKKSSSG